MGKIRNDLRCNNCESQEATALLYYEKYHVESGRTSLINPSFICDACRPLFLNCNQMFQDIPRLVPFEVLAQWDNRNHGILSKKGYEFNAFAVNPYFRKKIWRIKYIWKNGRKDAKEAKRTN